VSSFDEAVFRRSLPLLRSPMLEYVTELGRGERSPHLGVAIDDRGRLDLEGAPSVGRFLTFGSLWVTTTSDGGAPTATEGEQARFGPVFEGGMEITVFADHLVGLCSVGGSLAGPLGGEQRLPVLIFRVDLGLVDSVTIRRKRGLFGGVKEVGFVVLGDRFPPFVVSGESLMAIRSISSSDGRSDGVKCPGGAAGRAISTAVAGHRRATATGAQAARLDRVLAGEWVDEDGDLVAEMTVDDAPAREPVPGALPPMGAPQVGLGDLPPPTGPPLPESFPVPGAVEPVAVPSVDLSDLPPPPGPPLPESFPVPGAVEPVAVPSVDLSDLPPPPGPPLPLTRIDPADIPAGGIAARGAVPDPVETPGYSAVRPVDSLVPGWAEPQPPSPPGPPQRVGVSIPPQPGLTSLISQKPPSQLSADLVAELTRSGCGVTASAEQRVDGVLLISSGGATTARRLAFSLQLRPGVGGTAVGVEPAAEEARIRSLIERAL
jgi:hypothetical protein